MPRWTSFLLMSILLLLSASFVFAQDGNATVIEMAETLNVRAGASGRAAVVGEIPGGSAINVTGRNSTNRWYQVSTLDGSVSGWVASGFVNLRVARDTIPIVSSSVTTTGTTATTSTTTTSSEPVVPVSGATGTVNVTAANVRARASTNASIIAEVSRGTVVSPVARNSSSTWIQVQLADGSSGWIYADLLDLNVSRSSLPVAGATASTGTTSTTTTDNTSTSTASNVDVSVPAGEAPYFTLGANAANIFATGQELGNRANVFSKIGDSITVAEEMFTPFGYGVFNLGAYEYLRPTINFFNAQARNNNSWNNTSLAAGGGYTTRTVFSTDHADSSVCEPGESPLACEYRLTQPAVAIIMLGTNDTTNVPIDEFAHNMRVIVDFSTTHGVIPVMSTIPPRLDFPGRAESYNRVIVDIAAERGLPLIDLYSALVVLPESGMMDDGIHPSSPPLRFEQAADFTGNNLRYGYVIRNLTTLQALHVLRSQVLQ